MIADFLLPSLKVMFPRTHCVKPVLRTVTLKLSGIEEISTLPEALLYLSLLLFTKGEPINTTSRGVVATARSLAFKIRLTTTGSFSETR